jgi:hypothetical protein
MYSPTKIRPTVARYRLYRKISAARSGSLTPFPSLENPSPRCPLGLARINLDQDCLPRSVAASVALLTAEISSKKGLGIPWSCDLRSLAPFCPWLNARPNHGRWRRESAVVRMAPAPAKLSPPGRKRRKARRRPATTGATPFPTARSCDWGRRAFKVPPGL